MRTAWVGLGVLAIGAGGAAVSILAAPAPPPLVQFAPPPKRDKECLPPVGTALVEIVTPPVRPPPIPPAPPTTDGAPGATPRNEWWVGMQPPALRRESDDPRSRGRWTLPHLRLGEAMPTDILRATGATLAEAEQVRLEGIAEEQRMAPALRTLLQEHLALVTARVGGFEPDALATMDAATLCQTLAQATHLELAPAMSAMTEAEWRTFVAERPPLTDFVPKDGLMAAWVRAMHQVRRTTVERLGTTLRPTTLDALRGRFLLDGHFAFHDGRAFDFGRDAGQ